MFKLVPKEQLAELKKGVVDLVSEGELLKKLEHSYETKTPLRVKLGFDPSRPDIHIGHTVVLTKLRQFQTLGHHILFLIGDFTALIGDPTGMNKTRPPLTEDEIKLNSKSYADQVFKILDREKTEIVYNNDWMGKFSAADFVRLSAQYTVARMLERDDFKKRYGNQQPICIHEFLYPLVQGYDSVALKADVEIGGTDQLFNVLVGRDLQKAHGLPQQSILTMPLLEGLDGVNKMSKSMDNYIGVDETPKDIFGKSMRVSDELMFRYYELLTDLSSADIATLKADVKSGDSHPRDVKVRLAKLFVHRFCGEEAAANAAAEFEEIFVNKGLPKEIPILTLTETNPMNICELVVAAGFAKSKAEARRLVESKAVEWMGEKLVHFQDKVELPSGEGEILKVGKKRFVRVKGQ